MIGFLGFFKDLGLVLLGVLLYGLGEVIFASYLYRYNPSKFFRLQQAGDRLLRFLTGKDRSPLVDSHDDGEGEDGEDNEDEEQEQSDNQPNLDEEEGPEIELGTRVAYNDEKEDSYGVLLGTINDLPGDGTIGVNGPNGYVLVPYDEVAILEPPYENLILEGTEVIFVFTDSTYRKGVTFKADVIDGTLYYTVEYSTDDADIASLLVPAYEVLAQILVPPSIRAAAPTTQGHDGYTGRPAPTGYTSPAESDSRAPLADEPGPESTPVLPNAEAVPKPADPTQI